MLLCLEVSCGLPVSLDTETCELSFGDGLNEPIYCVRRLHDLDQVWANPVPDADRLIYRYTSGLHLDGDGPAWAAANVIYSIVVFVPGVFGGEYVKSSGQYHPPTPPSGMATPEIYTVLSGVGHFLLQKASPPYEVIEDAVLVEVQAGESFVVPPDCPLERLMGDAVLLDFSHKGKDEEITKQEILNSGVEIREGDIVLIRTDMHKLWKTPEAHERPCCRLRPRGQMAPAFQWQGEAPHGLQDPGRGWSAELVAAFPKLRELLR